MGPFIFRHKEGKTEMCFCLKTVADGLIEEIGLRVDGTEPSVTRVTRERCCEDGANSFPPIWLETVWLLLRTTCQVRGRTDDSTSRWKKNARQSVLSLISERSSMFWNLTCTLHTAWISPCELDTPSCTDQSDCWPMSLLQCQGCAYVPSFISVKI